jgi:phosphatidylinositol glycan class N
MVAGFLSAIMLLFVMRASRQKVQDKKTLMVFGTVYLIISGLCGYASTLEYLQSFPFVNPCHFIAWTVLMTSIPSAISTEAALLPRLASLSVALQSIYLLLSITYEGLFLLSLIATMIVWVLMEYKSTYAYGDFAEMQLGTRKEERNRKIMTAKDVQRALMFLFFSVVSFFGTGNIASLNSFDPKSIQTLVSVFSPFLMGSLLLLKVLIPFLVVACFVCVVQKISRMPSSAMFFLVLLFSDIMGLHFFFLVTDQGSWEQIGTSLSHFVITEGIVVFLQIFWIVAKYLLETPSYMFKSTYETIEFEETTNGRNNFKNI